MANDSIVVLYTSLQVLIAVACCLGNLLVIWAVWTCGAMRRQPTFRFIVSLAIADFLVGAMATPLRVLAVGRVQMSFYGCLTACCGVIFLNQVSVFSQLALAFDRFLRVIIPFRYKTMVTLQCCWWVVAACWLMAATVGFTPLMGWNNHTGVSQSNRSECQFLDVMSMSYLVYFPFYTCFLVPMLIMTIVYCCIFILIHRQLRSTSTVASYSYYHKERKLARSLVLVLVLFAVCWLPIQLMNMATFYGFTVTQPALYVGILLSQANSAINPVLYALKIQHIQAASKSIWRKFFQCKDQPQSSQTSGGDNCSNPRKTEDEKDTKSVETTEQGL